MHIEKDGKHYFWCIFCNTYIDANKVHNCAKDNTTPKTFKGSL